MSCKSVVWYIYFNQYRTYCLVANHCQVNFKFSKYTWWDLQTHIPISPTFKLFRGVDTKGDIYPSTDLEETTIGTMSPYSGPEEGLESTTQYWEGGFHPIHIGDVLNGRFEVVNKLGSGGFGVVWLCLDKKLNKWRAVKIMASKHSSKGKEQKVIQHLGKKTPIQKLLKNHIAIPIDEFWIQGPNGSHRCLVMPLLGCDVMSWRSRIDWREEESGIQLRQVCRQVTTALGFLHKHGVCHGDFRPGNILMQLDGIEDLSKDRMLDIIGKPDLRRVQKDFTATEAWPEYVLVPIPSHKWARFASPKVAVVDFGESFLADDPNESCGIPYKYAAPEILFGSKPGIGSDIWSLACTLYEIRSDQNFFGSGIEGEEMFDMVAELELPLGDLPEPYRNIWYENGYDKGRGDDDITDNEDDEDGNPVPNIQGGKYPKEGPVTWPSHVISQSRDNMIAETGTQTIFQAIVGVERRIGQWDSNLDEEPDYSDLTYHTYRYPKQETTELADLLESMLKWHAHERATTKDILGHPWLRKHQTSTQPCGIRWGCDAIKSIGKVFVLSALIAVILAATTTIYFNNRPREIGSEGFSLCRVRNEVCRELEHPVPFRYYAVIDG